MKTDRTPVRPNEAYSRDDNQGVASRDSATAGAYQKATVLLVDDDECFRSGYAAFLRSHGLRVIEAATGLQGLARVAEQPPDVVVVDLQMPLLPGDAFITKLKADPLTQNIGVVVLSSEGWRGRRRARVAGADVFCPKTCPPPHVVRVVEALVTRSRTPLP